MLSRALWQLVKRCLIPAAAVVAEAKAHSEPEHPRLCRPSELPIYIPEPICNVKHKVVEAPGILESTIRDTRETLTKYSDEVKAYQRVTQEHISKSKENIQWLVDYLHEEDNTLPRAGAVGIGALAGLIFGLRGGIIKRTLYATAGATGVAAICYPSEASEYSKVGITEAKKYLTVAYNFVYGDAPETKAPQEQVIASSEPDPEPSDSQIQDPLKIIAKAHEESVEKQCHCPIGACLGREEVAQNPENRTENVAHLPDALDALQFGMAQD
ncbi:unnamed protein product [Acanthoscelides obtectus]|uniref:MICOS complex subunit n=1 Tax=Acanthoscelides obtectus TaxID=200917 RepID=A0A9P0Q1P1_ACAOB|nr:unnamed protein product [Acanthoscelides obtectus]CAK1636572.1 MICOS complex subunit MIC27 [Acanthoscelides obtectus]